MRVGPARNSARQSAEGRAAEGAQAARGPVENVEDAGVGGRSDVLVRTGHEEVVAAVVVPVAGGEAVVRPLVAGLDVTDNASGALVDQLAACGGQPPAGTPEHEHRAGLVGRADLVFADRDGEVGEAVAVEVSGRHVRAAEAVAFGGVPGTELRGLVHDPVAVRDETEVAAVDDVHHAGVRHSADVFTGCADGKVVVAVAVEVAGRPAVPEPVAGPRRYRGCHPSSGSIAACATREPAADP